MDWSSPEILPVVGALMGVLLGGLITLLVEVARLMFASRERKMALSERVFEQKREAYVEFYRWALHLRHLSEDVALESAETLKLVKVLRTDPDKRAAMREDVKALASRLEARLNLDQAALLEDFRRCRSDIRFYGASKVAERGDALFAATIRFSAAQTTLGLITAANAHTESSTNVTPADGSSATVQVQSAQEDIKRTQEELDKADAAYLHAIKSDLGIKP